MKRAIITDHALLRYLERVKGIDVEGCREPLEKAFESPRMRRVIEFMGDTNCKIKSNGITYCVRGGRVMTCYPK